jgi:hypothetical protein
MITKNRKIWKYHEDKMGEDRWNYNTTERSVREPPTGSWKEKSDVSTGIRSPNL